MAIRAESKPQAATTPKESEQGRYGPTIPKTQANGFMIIGNCKPGGAEKFAPWLADAGRRLRGRSWTRC